MDLDFMWLKTVRLGVQSLIHSFKFFSVIFTKLLNSTVETDSTNKNEDLGLYIGTERPIDTILSKPGHVSWA